MSVESGLGGAQNGDVKEQGKREDGPECQT